MAFPRIMARAGSFAFVTVPERIDSIFGLRHGGSMIAEATGNRTWNMVSEALSSGPVMGSALPTASRTAQSTTNTGKNYSSLTAGQMKNFGGIFTYMTSKWALACFTLVGLQSVIVPMLAYPQLANHVQSLVLNRTQIYSAARRHITLAWPLRLALRIAPILLFLHHTLSFLHAMRCQTSPNFSMLKYGKADKRVDLDFSGDGGLLYWISSTLLFWGNDGDSCLAVDLIPSRSEVWDRKGSLSLLWPLFRSMCLGQFVETLSCAIQGRPLMTETGMSIFESSLAFAESEATISNRLGLSWSGSSAKGSPRPSTTNDATVAKLFTKSEILSKMNTPPEVLLMGLISSLNNLSSQILGVFNMQAKFRLLNTGVWGLCFMSAFVWGFLSLRPESGPDAIIPRFPTVCIVGFIPHLLVLFGIMICGFIHLLALFLCILSPPPDGPRPQSLSDRIRLAQENMQANAQLSSMRLNMHEDFYSALLKIGFSALTVASEAVYLNEGQRISVARLTWLEEDRMKEIEAFERSNDPSQRLSIHLETPKAADSFETAQPNTWRSGYSKLNGVKAVKGSDLTDSRLGTDGVGHMQRGGRYIRSARFLRSIFWLWVNWLNVIANVTLDRIGIAWRPRWLKLSKRDDVAQIRHPRGSEQQSAQKYLDFWVLSDDGEMKSPENDDIDVAYEMRKRQQYESEGWGVEEEQTFEARTYNWWKSGGWWGERDESGSYAGSIRDDDDVASVLSMSTTTSDSDTNDNSMDIDSGATTPTQRHPYPSDRSASPTPSIDQENDAFDPEGLAQLLDPQSKESRSDARMLAHHLRAPRITTRSRYRQAQSLANTKLLTSTRYKPPHNSLPATGPLSPEEEAQFLEQLILARRSEPISQTPAADTWRDGAEGIGQGGPQCVVCQSAPRTILAWPCRCLSLCEDCRVSLAMNNFGTCVCCRQEVVGFSRLYVP